MPSFPRIYSLDFFIIIISTILLLSLLSSSSTSVRPFANAQTKSIYSCVKENKVAFSNAGKINAFTTKILSGVVNMTFGNTALYDPKTVNSFYQQIGLVRVTSTIEVNDSYTNVYLEFSNRETANKVLEAVNMDSWNPVKSTKMVMATDSAPPVPVGEPRHVLFGGIVAVATIFSAGLSAFIVRRLAIRKYEKANRANKDMANLENQLLQEQLKQLKGAENMNGGAGAGGSPRNNKKFGGDEPPHPADDPYSPMGTQEFPGSYNDYHDNDEESLVPTRGRGNSNTRGRRSSSRPESQITSSNTNNNKRRVSSSRRSSQALPPHQEEYDEDDYNDDNYRSQSRTSRRTTGSRRSRSRRGGGGGGGAPTESDVYSEYGGGGGEEDMMTEDQYSEYTTNDRRSAYSRRSSRRR